MKNRLKEFFDSENIEYFSIVDFDKCQVVNARLVEVENFKPQSVIVFLMPYYTGESINVSRYAVSVDYHLVFSRMKDRFFKFIETYLPQYKFLGFSDHSPINERRAAAVGGLGVLGDNRLLLNEKYGSYVFIGEFITNAPPSELGGSRYEQIKGCIGCGICRKNCPTGILRSEASECLSEITQRKGVLAPHEIDLIRKIDTVWGCDECQRGCPYNANPVFTPIQAFWQGRNAEITTELINDMNDEEFKSRAYSWRGRKTILRNLEIKENSR